MKIKKAIALMIGLVLIVSTVLPGTLAVSTDQSAANSTLTLAGDTELKVSPETVALEKSREGKLTADAGTLTGTYQWQIQVSDGAWVNILGANEKTLTVTYGLVASLLLDNTARIRCHMTPDTGKALDSNVVTVQIQPDAAKAPAMSPAIGTVTMEAKALGDPVIVPAPAADQTPADESVQEDAVAPTNDTVEGDESAQPEVTPQDNENNETPAAPTTYVIQIVYQYQNGEQAANPWTATVAAGSSYSQEIQSPIVVGYEPDQKSVKVDVTDINQDKTYTVTYKAAEVEFTVKHYKQNVSDDKYTLEVTETKTGFTESAVGEKLAKTDYSGFYSLLYDTTTKVAADGSTVVEIYYDRYYYLMTFDLDGGYGVEPIYARYGTTISVSEPTRPGYTFVNWTPSIPATMPVDGGTYKATWKAGTSGFTVVFWYENANDDGYSVAGTYKPVDVAPGTQRKSDDYKNQPFTGRDNNHFTYNADKAETVTVSGDGSTVLNVYFTRNTYTLTFKGGKTEITCGKEEHKHTRDGSYLTWDGWYYYGGCYPAGSYNGIGTGTGGAKSPTCGKSEHTHSNSCYKTSDLTITAKYQEDIHGNFPIKDEDGTIWWTVPRNCESFESGNYLGSIDTMPGENIIFTKHNSQSGAKLYYYVETLNGASGEKSYNGKNYNLYKVIDLKSSGINLTYKEEFHPILGFTQGDSSPKLPVNGSVSVQKENYLYYTRNSYNLKFYNYNAFVSGKGGSVQYEAPLGGYNFTPDYPANLEKNAYEFAGWYTTSDCYAGSEADLSKMTMPAADMVLYAKWVPKTHTVKTWLTDKMDVKVEVGNTGSNEQTVAHGTTAEKPEDPKNGNYTFVGWFYKDDNGVEKAFDFSMPVNRDLDLYAKWNSNTLVTYTIKYAIENEDGTLTYIADATTGSALAGSTKTFDAKTGTELNEGYQSGYFPQTSSHSLTMDISGGNEFTFIYVQKDKVPYTVKYLEVGTEKELAKPKTDKTSSAVITETFVAIEGYAPDAYQKRLVLSAEGENVIIFWYTKDDVHAPVQVIHWIQNIAGEGYTEYQSSTDLNAKIREKQTSTALTIPGFTYVKGTAVSGDNTTNFTKPETPEAELTEAGLVLNLYYDRNMYPYEFRFLEQGTNTELAEPVTGSARYQAQVTQTAEKIPGYTLVSAENQAINIAIEDPADKAVKNVKIFYYTEQTVDIVYKVVGPDGCGTLDNYQENRLKAMTGTPMGSTPTANPGFKFVGWFMDEPCLIHVENIITGAVNPTTNKMTPQKRPSDNLHFAATYYAKFEYDVADLTITKTGWKDIDENQSFIFKVAGPNGFEKTVVIYQGGSVKITGLKIGTYTVTEVTNWSWRYTPDESRKSITLSPTETNEVTFTNTRSNDKWLGGDAYNQNKFENSN